MVRCARLWCFRLLLLVAVGCDHAVDSPPPPSPTSSLSYCATDFSCPPGQECIGGACAPIQPALRPHIQTASALIRSPLPGEAAWRAQKFDLLIGVPSPDESRAVNPRVRLFEYSLIRFHRFDTGTRTARAWAIAHGYDSENFYLHYKVDTYVPTWEGRVIVPGYPAGMVPGWDPGGPGPSSAQMRAHSRVVGYYPKDPTVPYLANLADPGFREFMVYRISSLIDGTWWSNTEFASGPVDGIMADEAIYYPLFKEGLLDRSAEYFGVPLADGHPYAIAIEEFYPYLSEALLDRFGSTLDVMPNYGHVLFLNYPNRSAINIQAATPWAWGEVWVSYTGTSSPTSGASRCATYDRDYENAVRAVVRQSRSGGRRVLGARDTSSGNTGSERGKLFTLGLYYLVHGPGTYYMYESATHNFPAHVETWSYNPAVEFDVGQPNVLPPGVADFNGAMGTREHWVFASGSDPYAPSLTYRVLARRFMRALVLVKMLPLGSVVDSRSVTVHPLGGSYRPLRADGTLGDPVTEASIRNNEALILIPQVPTGVQ